MKEIRVIKKYSATEEKINIISHATGCVLSIAGLALLVVHAALHGTVRHVVSFTVFGASLIVSFAASALYHNAEAPDLRQKLRILDHASIYILIAGTYTPFTLVTLKGPVGWSFFAISWGLACVGIVLKLFFTGRYTSISTLMYVFMGWMIIFAIKPIINNLPLKGLLWLIAGGMAYTLGAILYNNKKIQSNHAIFHIFVLIGSVCQFVSVYFYVLPWA